MENTNPVELKNFQQIVELSENQVRMIQQLQKELKVVIEKNSNLYEELVKVSERSQVNSVVSEMEFDPKVHTFKYSESFGTAQYNELIDKIVINSQGSNPSAVNWTQFYKEQSKIFGILPTHVKTIRLAFIDELYSQNVKQLNEKGL